jgi:hypothetical protein
MRHKQTITSTFISNGHLYYSFSGDGYRVDSISGRLLMSTNSGCPWLNNEMLIDSLSAHRFDSCRAYCDTVLFTHCNDTSIIVIFGLSKPSKAFDRGVFENFQNRTYVKDIGLTNMTQTGGSGYSTDDLIGCVINGVLYGDTSLTGLEPVSTRIPSDYKLSQNYPNPFNPSTKIKFDIPLSPLSSLPASERERGAGGFVTLKIYDILGREVAMLVNEQLKPGTYEVEWDGSNYPSGVYYYRLITGEFSETKRMVLIK